MTEINAHKEDISCDCEEEGHYCLNCVLSYMLASFLSINKTPNLSPAFIHHKSNMAAAVLDAMIRDFCSLALICLLLTSCEP